jgi:pimeloyl-ACP methyl ester carboxylesterase
MERHLPTAKIRAKRFFRTLFPAAAILILGIAGLFSFFVYKVSYPEAATEAVNPSHYLLPYLAVEIPCGKDSGIPAWWIPGLKHAPGVVLAPGYGMSRSDALSLAVVLNQHGFNLLIYAQRGSGSLPKGASALGLQESEDMASAIQFLKKRAESDPARIGIWGVDIGAFAALKAAAAFPEVCAIAADSPYETVQSYLDYRITEDFGLENSLMLFGCRQVFRLVHLFSQASLNTALPLNALSGKAILFIKGEDRPRLADLTTAIYKKIQPQKEMISFRTARIHAMSGEILKAYDMQAADFFHINLK